MSTKLLLLFLLWMGVVWGQKMEYHFGYIFKETCLSKYGKLYLVKEIERNRIDTVGSFTMNETEFKITNAKKVTKNEYSEIHIFSKLKGVVKERNRDTLFVKFWNITQDAVLSQKTNIITSAENDKDFAYVIKTWKGRKPHFDLPYKYGQLLATNIPFRILTKSGNVESDFLNANASYVFVWGKTRVFKSEFVENRNSYFAIGPFVGLSSIDNPIDDKKKEFGLNYGVNLVGGFRGLNLIVAYGFQNGFKTETKKNQPYLGFGIGFNLLETFSPEIKNKEL